MKFVQIVAVSTTSAVYLFALDENGHVWEHGRTGWAHIPQVEAPV